MSDFLSQEEIDALLRGAAAPDEPEAEGNEGQDSNDPDDWPSSDGEQDLNGEEDYLDEIERDALAEVGNISMGAAATALSAILNHRVLITVPKVDMTTRAEVRENYPIPCLVINVKYVEGLEGSNLLVIKEIDAAVIASLMMGEDGFNPPEVLTDLHVSAVTEAMNQMMGSSATAMSDMFGARIQITPPEVEQLDLQSNADELPVEEPVVQVSFRIQVEGLLDSEMLQLIELDFAKSMVQRLLDSSSYMGEEVAAEVSAGPQEMASAVWEEESRVSSSTAVEAPPWSDFPGGEGGLVYSPGELGNLNIALIRDIPVRVRAILGRSRLPIETILRLGPGSIVELDTIDGEPIEILANDTLIAKGEVVVVGEQFGVRITEISTPRERISSVR
ncbi:MAG: flagellar motor switch phosphatase FliY [Firmicutes bacterium]|nr:flagellar motor switch phosphatase FliY [Bacillota bacterium]